MRAACLIAALLTLWWMAPSCSGGCGGSASESGKARDIGVLLDDGGLRDVPPTVIKDTGRDQGSAGPDDGTAADVLFGGPKFGLPCEGHGDCDGGWCVEGPDGAACTVDCVDYCPEGWSCKAIALGGGSDLTSVCVPKEAKVCEPCEERADCGGIPECAAPANVSSVEEGGTCLLACDGMGAPCPGGFVCTLRPLLPGLEPSWVCAPGEGVSCCAKANEGLEEDCTRENEHGTCQGIRTCHGVERRGPECPRVCRLCLGKNGPGRQSRGSHIH